MARVIAGMTTSLDGFVADERGGVDRLYPDLAALQGTAYMNAAIEETGAVLMGKRTFEMAEDLDSYVGNYEFQVPIFVLTPPRTARRSEAGRAPDLHIRDRRRRVSDRAREGRRRHEGRPGGWWCQRGPAASAR